MKYWYLIAPAFGALVMLSLVVAIAQAGFAHWFTGALSAYLAMVAQQRFALADERRMTLRIVDRACQEVSRG